MSFPSECNLLTPQMQKNYDFRQNKTFQIQHLLKISTKLTDF